MRVQITSIADNDTHATVLLDADEVAHAIDDAWMRRQIVERYAAGWSTASHALKALIGLNLVECDPALLPYLGSVSND